MTYSEQPLVLGVGHVQVLGHAGGFRVCARAAGSVQVLYELCDRGQGDVLPMSVGVERQVSEGYRTRGKDGSTHSSGRERTTCGRTWRGELAVHRRRIENEREYGRT